MDPTAVAILIATFLWGLWKFEEWLRGTTKGANDPVLLIVLWAMRITIAFSVYFLTIQIPMILMLLTDAPLIHYFTGWTSLTWVMTLLFGLFIVGIMIYMALSSLKQLGALAKWRGGRKGR